MNGRSSNGLGAPDTLGFSLGRASPGNEFVPLSIEPHSAPALTR